MTHACLTIVFTTINVSLLTIDSSKAIPAEKHEAQLTNEKRFSPKMRSRTGRCEIININGFKDQSFPCKIQIESGRGWWIFVQPLGSDDDAYHEGAFLTFNGYSEECGFGIGCPFRFEEGKLSKALQKASSPNKTPSDFYIRKWDRFRLELIFDQGIPKSVNSNSTYESIFVFRTDTP